MIAAAAIPVPPDGVGLLLRKTADEEQRVRAGADGARIEVWRRVATIDVPHPTLSSLVYASDAERAQLALPLDSIGPWGDEDTLPFAVVSRTAT